MEYVKALVKVAEEELQPVGHPRVFSLTKIVEISHFNMGRIRYPPPLKGSLASWRSLCAVFLPILPPLPKLAVVSHVLSITLPLKPNPTPSQEAEIL